LQQYSTIIKTLGGWGPTGELKSLLKASSRCRGAAAVPKPPRSQTFGLQVWQLRAPYLVLHQSPSDL